MTNREALDKTIKALGLEEDGEAAAQIQLARSLAEQLDDTRGKRNAQMYKEFRGALADLVLAKPDDDAQDEIAAIASAATVVHAKAS